MLFNVTSKLVSCRFAQRCRGLAVPPGELELDAVLCPHTPPPEVVVTHLLAVGHAHQPLRAVQRHADPGHPAVVNLPVGRIDFIETS